MLYNLPDYQNMYSTMFMAQVCNSNLITFLMLNIHKILVCQVSICLLIQPDLRFLLLLLFICFCFLFLFRGKRLSLELGPWVKVWSPQVLCTAQCVGSSWVPALCQTLGWLQPTSANFLVYTSLPHPMLSFLHLSMQRMALRKLDNRQKVFALCNALDNYCYYVQRCMQDFYMLEK